MKNSSFYIPLLILIAAACNNNSSIQPHSDPNISIENQQGILNIYPLDTIQLNIHALTTSDEPISSFTSYNNCMEKLSKDPDNVRKDEYIYQYKGIAPYEKGETEILFTAYTDKGETADITQKINVLEAPFMIEIDSTNVPEFATEGTSFTVSGILKSKIPFNNIRFSTSVIEGGFNSVDENIINELPQSDMIGFTITNHNYTKDESGYSIYSFHVTYTVTAKIHNGDDNTPPTTLDHFDLLIGYNFYNPNQIINCSERTRFGNWRKTVNIE